MDSFVDERDFQILEDDKYTFFMLRRIIGGKCKLLRMVRFTDAVEKTLTNW